MWLYFNLQQTLLQLYPFHIDYKQRLSEVVTRAQTRLEERRRADLSLSFLVSFASLKSALSNPSRFVFIVLSICFFVLCPSLYCISHRVENFFLSCVPLVSVEKSVGEESFFQTKRACKRRGRNISLFV